MYFFIAFLWIFSNNNNVNIHPNTLKVQLVCKIT